MKKSLTIITLFLWTFTTIIYARTPQEAAQIASQFFTSQRSTSLPAAQRSAQQTGTLQQPVTLAFTQYTADASAPALYVFNHADQGFVLVSAEDDAQQVLGYSHHSTFHPDRIPANLSFWLQTYADDIADYRAAIQSPAFKLRRLQGPYNDPPAPQASFTPVEPILGDVQWGQGTPYNDLTPYINNSKTPAGCVATALAQIMYTHKYPTRGTGSYSYSLGGGLTLSADFGATTYDWDNMIPQYRVGQYTATQASAVSTLMYHVGIASHMYYGPSGSGAVSYRAMLGLIQHFDYDPGIQTLMKDYMGPSTMLQHMADELLAGRAIYMSGATVNNEGHAFVCDGINETGFLHINWGWDGYCDGYFALFALSPAEHGTGGSTTNMAFTVGVDAYTGIQPNQGGTPQPLVTIDSYTTNKTSYPANASISITCNYFSNIGLGQASGSIYLAAYDHNGQLRDKVRAGSINLSTYTMYNSIPFRADEPLDLPDGNYQLALELHSDQTIHPIYLLHCGEMRLPIQVSNGTIQLGTMQAEEDIEPFQAIRITNQNQTRRWIIDATSPNYHGAAFNGQSLSATIYSDNPNSIIGSYVLDPTNSGQPGTIASDVIYAIGNSQSNALVDLRDLHITITPANNDSLLVQFLIQTKYIGTLLSSNRLQPAWYLFNGMDTQPYDQVSYQLSASLSASQALAICNAQATNQPSAIHYYVTGRIAEMQTTPTQIVSSQKASFRFSDLGTPLNTLSAKQIAPLDSRFATGNEIQPGYSVTVFGPLQKTSEPAILGQLAAITPGEFIDYSVHSLRLISLEGAKVTVGWETLAPQVEVSIYNSKRKLLGKRFMTDKQISFAVPAEGLYTISVQPTDEQQNFLDHEVKLTIDVTSTEPTDLDHLTTPDQAYLYDLFGRLIDVQSTTHPHSWQVPTDGIYILITGDQAQKLFLTK